MEQEEKGVERGLAMETRTAIEEEFGMTESSSARASPGRIYFTTARLATPNPISTTASSLMRTTIPIYSSVTSRSRIPSTFVPIYEAITDNLRYALGQAPHHALIAQQTPLEHSTMSEQAPTSFQMLP